MLPSVICYSWSWSQWMMLNSSWVKSLWDCPAKCRTWWSNKSLKCCRQPRTTTTQSINKQQLSAAELQHTQAPSWFAQNNIWYLWRIFLVVVMENVKTTHKFDPKNKSSPIHFKSTCFHNDTKNIFSSPPHKINLKKTVRREGLRAVTRKLGRARLWTMFS